MKKIFLLLVALIIAFSTNLLAQKLSFSPLTYYGIGEINFQGNARQLSMGHTGIADFNIYHISKVNPASISSLRPNNVIFEIGLFHRISNFDNGIEKQTNNLSNFRNIYGAFRITPWWHTSFGLSPLSASGYKIITDDSVSVDDYTSVFNISYEGIGNINQTFWGNSFTIFKKLYVGINLNYNFGSFDRQQNIIMSTDSTYISVTLIKDRSVFHKINYDLGFIYSDTIKRNSQEVLRFSIGGIYSNKSTINTIDTKYAARTVSYLGLSFIDSIFYDTTGASKIVLPQTFGGGFSVTYKKKLTFSGDYIVRKWSKSEVLGQNNFFDSRFIGFGMEYCQSPISTRYLRTIRYRLGGYQNNSYLSYNNQQVITQALTAGIGLPIKNIMLNIGFTYGQTGSLDLGLKENFYEFNLGISLYDLWFIKRKFM